MERYMLHLHNNGYVPLNSRDLFHKARELCSDLGALVRVARVASKFVEFDVSVEKEKLDSVIKKLNTIGKLDNARHIVEEEIEKEDGIKDGIFYFNNERFWESHEAFEGVWKKCFGKEKKLVQGIILVAVAFAHSQKNDDAIGLGMLGRAAEKLGNSPSMYHNIDVDRIRNKIKDMQNSGELVRFQI
jgi:predicted metal-dependent hydrolase